MLSPVDFSPRSRHTRAVVQLIRRALTTDGLAQYGEIDENLKDEIVAARICSMESTTRQECGCLMHFV